MSIVIDGCILPIYRLILKFEILLRKPVDKSIAAYLTNTKTSGLENTVEMVYPTGGRGNIYVGGGFAHSRRATLSVTNATFNTEVMALQSGTELFQGSTNIQYYEILTAGADGKLATKFTAQGTAGSEILFLYKVDPANGTYIKKYEQADTAAEGKFTYTTSTKEIALADADKPLEGEMFAVTYEYKSADNAQVITVTGDGIPATVLCTAYGLAKDTCTGELFPCQVDGMAQIDGNWNFDLSADGDPVVQNLSMEFVKGCMSSKLYDFKVYTEDEAEADEDTKDPVGP